MEKIIINKFVKIAAFILCAFEQHSLIAMKDASSYDPQDTKLMQLISKKPGLDVIKKFIIKEKVSVNETNIIGTTPIFLAVGQRNQALVRLLHKKGALLNNKHSLETSLEEAVYKQDMPMVQLLLRLGADINLAKTFNGRTVLHAAVYFAWLANHHKLAMLEMIPLLIQHGADVSKVDNDGKTALNLAIQLGLTEVAEVLESNKALSTCNSKQIQIRAPREIVPFVSVQEILSGDSFLKYKAHMEEIAEFELL